MPTWGWLEDEAARCGKLTSENAALQARAEVRILERYTAPNNRVSYTLRLPFGYQWDTYDWSLNGPEKVFVSGTRMHRQVFSLKCGCGRWSAGCSKHWLCGLCKLCEPSVEARPTSRP